jgi:putative endonuclease
MKYKMFEELPCWQEARKLCQIVYQTISRGKFQKDYSLKDQIWRSAGSVMDNTGPVKELEAKMYYTYILESKKDGGFYTGSTRDLKLRFEQHRRGRVDSTKDRVPLRLIYYEACLDRSDAQRREKYLKTYHGKMFLRRRLKSYLTG